MAKARISAFKRRVSDRDRLCYALVIAFGVCLLLLMIFFSLGYQLGEVQADPFYRTEDTAPEQKLLLIDEPNPVIRGIEMTIAVGMIVLGVERFRTTGRQKKERLVTLKQWQEESRHDMDALHLGVPREELES